MPLSKKTFFVSSSKSSQSSCTVKSFVNDSGAGSSSEAATSSPTGKNSSRDEAFVSSAKSSQAWAIASVSPSADSNSS